MSSESRFPAWAWAIIGAITVLALTILVFSVVMGIRAGQAQVEVQRRQQIGIALQQATDLQLEGRLQDALDQYQKVLVLDPSNQVAQQGIQNLLTLAASGTPVAAAPAPVVAAPTSTPVAATTGATPATAAATTAISATTGATPAGNAADEAWARAQAAGKAGRWQVALNELIALRQSNPGYRTTDVTALLTSSYVNLAAERDNDDNLEEALALYDKALALQADPGIKQERDLIAMYLDVLTYSDADWPRAITLLEELYAEDPQYRDVEVRLQEAHTAYGDQLAADEQWCTASEEYESALSVINNDATVLTKRDAAKTECTQIGNVAAGGSLTGTSTTSTTGIAVATPLATVAFTTGTDTSSTGGPAVGTLLYSAKDVNSGRPQIFELPVRIGSAQLLLQEAAQPAMRGDGTRLAFRNLRSNAAGISGFDPDTGLMLRFTTYAEDSTPSWNSQGSRIVFASNREGDRRWRIYTVWAENDGATETLGFGESPSWSQSSDLIAYRGCDTSGNNCGIWTMSGEGAGHAPVTRVAEDTRPSWAPDGSFIVFMSSSRDGNNDIYRVDTATGEVINLSANPAVDALPAVSPDGEWVAFASNRDGAWKIYAAPSSGGPATLVAPIIGDLGNWSDQGLQWTW